MEIIIYVKVGAHLKQHSYTLNLFIVEKSQILNPNLICHFWLYVNDDLVPFKFCLFLEYTL